MERLKPNDTRIIFEIQVEKFSEDNYGYKLLEHSNTFMTLHELFDLIKEKFENGK